jgi:hypothetical protein
MSKACCAIELIIRPTHSCVPLDQMDTGLSLYNGRDLSRLERKRSLFEFCLHIASSEESTVISD